MELEENQASFETSNINSKWLENIYENLKNIEQLERLSREGCTSIIDYFQIPFEQRAMFLGDAQYKNLRFLVTEIDLLLTDLTPVVNETNLATFRKVLEQIEAVLPNRELFITEIYSAKSNSITRIETTEIFNRTLYLISLLRIEIIKEISPVLYIKKRDNVTGFHNR